MYTYYNVKRAVEPKRAIARVAEEAVKVGAGFLTPDGVPYM
jgi:hypothetical protein